MDTANLYDRRVIYYLKYRPGYPYEIIDHLIKMKILNSTQNIVDMGCGTGLLSKIFLKNGNTIVGIEPNSEMRDAALQCLKNYVPDFFSCLNGSAESSGLLINSVDHIICGESFHWFQLHPTIREFKRILRPQGYLIIVSNWEYEQLGFTNSYPKIIQKYLSNANSPPQSSINWNKVYLNGEFQVERFWLNKLMSFDELLGYTLSLSRIPLPGEQHFDQMKQDLLDSFNLYNKNNKITFRFKIELKYGHI